MIGTVMQGKTRNHVSFRESESGIGIHVLADFWGGESPDDAIFWSDLLTRVTQAMGATLLHIHVEPFTNKGVTAVAVLAESHVSIHTWPERDYVAIDLFTCGDHVAPDRGIDVLRAALSPAREHIVRHVRGESVRAVENLEGIA